MGDINQQTESIHVPYIIFRLKGSYYTISSRNTYSIMNMPEFTVIPEVPQYVDGMFMFQGEPTTLVNLRALFGIETLAEEYKEFAAMIGHRKQDHIHWANELERCVDTGESFNLATDPHKCAFGKWYDNFNSDNNYINFHLKKIDEPHKNLHKAAEDVFDCSRQCNECNRDECLITIMKKVKGKYVPTVVDLLDKAVDVMKSSYREMVIVMIKGEKRVGLIVDEVLSVEDLLDMGDTGNINKLKNSRYIEGIKKSSRLQDPVLRLNENELLNAAEGIA